MPIPKDPSRYNEWRRKISESLMGNVPWNKGGRHSEESIKRMREAHKKENLSDETLEKMRISHLGYKRSEESIRKGIETSKKHPYHHSEEIKKKISMGNKGKIISQEQRKIISDSRKSHPLPKEHYERLSLLFKGRESPMKGRHHSDAAKKKISGENNVGWRGGVSFEPYCPKFTNELKERIRAFYNYTCVECGTRQNGKMLDVHHVNFNKMSCCDKTPPLFVSLCSSCHGKTIHNREYWERYFTKMIDEYYQGKCYFTKEEYEKLVLI